MPEPKDKKGEAVRVRLGAARASIAHEFMKVLDKKLEWVGPFELTGSDTFILMVTVLAKDASEAVRLGVENGMDSLGKLQRVASTAKRSTPDEEPERASEKAMRLSKGGTVTVQESEAKDRIKSWWKCPNCKRFIKAGAEAHYAKYTKCAEAARA